MKVLLSAYACGPHQGSEPEVGLQALLAALSRHEVWLLTQRQFIIPLEVLLKDHPHRGRAHLIGVEPPAPSEQPGLRSLARTQWAHERWQRNAAAVAAALHADVGFDVAHHVTLAAYWMRTGVAELDVPLVWGPVGGGVEAPKSLLPVLGWRGAVEDAGRSAGRVLMAARPSGRRTAATAKVVLVQNPETAARTRRDDARVLPNAVCVRAEDIAGSDRRRDVAVVGRVVPWKGVPLAVRALGQMSGSDVRLRVYGAVADRERARLVAAARRAGVAERVDLMGRLPRHQLLERVATSGVVLHASLHDEASFTVAEALMLGTPVVALAHGGPPHVASHFPGAEARFVRPTTPGRTARALAGAVEDLLALHPRVRRTPASADVSFGQVLLNAYDEAVAG